MTEVEHSIEF